MKQLLLSKLPALFAALAAEQKLYIPADDAAGQANFTLWREGLQLTKKLNTVRSAKDLVLPAGGKPRRLPRDGQAARSR